MSNPERAVIRGPQSFEDPRIGGINARLDAQPGLRERIQQLFQTDFERNFDLMVGIRSEDIVSVLDSISRGKLPTGSNSQGKQNFHKEPGWYYLTPNYAHPVYTGRRPVTKFDRQQSMRMLIGLTHLFYRQATLMAAFVQNIEPLLRNNWQDQAKQLVMQAEIEGYEAAPEWVFSPQVVKELWCQVLFDEITGLLYLREKGYPLRVPQLLAQLERMLDKPEPELFKSMLRYLMETQRNRAGILVGFSAAVLEGRRFLTNADNRPDVIHANPEMAIEAPHGITRPLDSMVAISIPPNIENQDNPFNGVYEIEILKKLGIWEPS